MFAPGPIIMPPAQAPIKRAFASLASNYTTSSTTAIATGESVSLTCGPSGTIVFRGTGVLANNTANDSVEMSIYRTTGTAPAAGSAPGSGDSRRYDTTRTRDHADYTTEISTQVMDTGLTSGQVYAYYRTINTPSGGTSTIYGGSNQSTLYAETW
jgi:hypothetical protein